MSVLSGQKTVASAGTAEALGSGRINGPLRIKALAGNTNNVYVGNDGAGDVTSDNGFVLDAGEDIIFAYVGDLASIILDVDTNGEGVSWCALGVM